MQYLIDANSAINDLDVHGNFSKCTIAASLMEVGKVFPKFTYRCQLLKIAKIFLEQEEMKLEAKTEEDVRGVTWESCFNRDQDLLWNDSGWDILTYLQTQTDQKGKIQSHKQSCAHVETWRLSPVSLRASRESWLFRKMWCGDAFGFPQV